MLKLGLPRVYAIADVQVLAGRGVSLRDFALALRAAGVGMVQYRDKVGSAQEVLRGAAILLEVFGGVGVFPGSTVKPSNLGHPILIMNDRADLARLAGFDGVHVGQGDMLPEDAQAVLASGFPIHAVRPHEWGTRDDQDAGRGGGVAGVGVFPGSTVRPSNLGHPVLIMNDRADLARLAGFDGVHVGQGDMLPEDAQAVLASGFPIHAVRPHEWGTRDDQDAGRGGGVAGDGVFPGSTVRPSNLGHPILIMNDRADLARLAGFDGVHVGQGDMLPEDAQAVLASGFPIHAVRPHEWGTRDDQDAGRGGGVAGDGVFPGSTVRPSNLGHPASGFTQAHHGSGRGGGIVGVSTHTEAQVRAADVSCADYVAFGPVFATGTKADAEAVVGLAGLRRARALTTKPLVAIGGITAANARSVIEAGADSVAVISALVSQEVPTAQLVQELMEAMR